MKRLRTYLSLLGFVCLSACTINESNQQSSLEDDFRNPKTSQKPYVWWHWMGPNFSLDGITKDLEAMKEQGIGGATIFNITSAVQESQSPTKKNPWPHQVYRGKEYWEAVRHAAKEANRLGLEIGLHNTAGYSTTGGPWIDEERSIQRVLWSETDIQGGTSVNVQLPVPPIPDRRGWGGVIRKLSKYTDIGVIACPSDTVIKFKDIIDLSTQTDREGNLTWEAPAGQWKVYRFISASTGYAPHPLPDELIDNKTFEVDKMTLENTIYHWENVLNPLKEHLGEYMGKSFKHILIDSYEAGHQSWSVGFRQTFIKEKGYDPLPWMVSLSSALTSAKRNNNPQRVIEDSLQTERFEWDYRDVIAQMFIENGWKPAAKMINEADCKLQFEAYGGPIDIIASTRVGDIPMGEFWTPNSKGIRKDVAGSARAAGKILIGAEAFTGAPGNSQWNEDPAYLKSSGDYAFLSGVNRLILHHWVHQPYDDTYKPGLSMGWWGTHFSRHQTWSKTGKAYFDYLARCQAVLQHGEEVKDYLSVEKSGDGDAIAWRDFVQEAKVVDGKVRLVSGRSYKLVELAERKAIQPELLKKVYALLQEGATILAPVKPEYAMGLTDFPACDEEVKKYADKMWPLSGQNSRKIGKGQLITMKLDDALKQLDANNGLITTHPSTKWIQRREGNQDIFFIVNTSKKAVDETLSFKVMDKVPELWSPYTGEMKKIGKWMMKDDRTMLDIRLEANTSTFVIFREKSQHENQITKICLNDTAICIPVYVENGRSVWTTDKCGNYQIHFQSGAIESIQVDSIPTPILIQGRWNVQFKPATDEPEFEMQMDELIAWNNHPEKIVNYFSGTAHYQIEFEVSQEDITASVDYELCLGTLSSLAKVYLNGTEIGTVWHSPFKLGNDSLRKAIKAGKNRLEIVVTNTWKNRLIGDEQLPEDMEWGKERHFGGKYSGRSLVKYPDWFIKKENRPSVHRKTFVIWNYFTPESTLDESGLQGPVTLYRYPRCVWESAKK